MKGLQKSSFYYFEIVNIYLNEYKQKHESKSHLEIFKYFRFMMNFIHLRETKIDNSVVWA